MLNIGFTYVPLNRLSRLTLVKHKVVERRNRSFVSFRLAHRYISLDA